MLNSLVAVNKGLPLRQAAEMYRVPKSTLHDHVSGKVAYGAKPGPDPYLSVEEEEELASFFKQQRSGTHTRSDRFLNWCSRSLMRRESLQL